MDTSFLAQSSVLETRDIDVQRHVQSATKQYLIDVTEEPTSIMRPLFAVSIVLKQYPHREDCTQVRAQNLANIPKDWIRIPAHGRHL